MQGIKTLYEYASGHGCVCKLDAPMSLYTTFRIGGPADILLEPQSEEQLIDILKKCKELSINYFILGNGSNLLVSHKGIEGAVILIGPALSKISLTSENTIYAQAGVKLSSLCKFALDHNISGFEQLWGIPGNVGGAIYMNAGAYGGEIKDVLISSSHINPDFEIGEFIGEQNQLSYRHSAYSDSDFVILSGVFKGKTDSKENIEARMNDYMQRRLDKQPLDYPSAGSTFKRPEGYFAAALIEECALKGRTVGGACVSEKHSGFVINKGGATAQDVLDLVEIIKDEVLSQKGVTLECEIRMVGR